MADDPNANNTIRLEGSADPVTVSGLAAPLPTDRIFRGAWRLDGKKNVVSVDMTLALPIAQDRLRAARAGKFPQLDADYMRADEVGDTAAKSAIAARKKTLRDVTKDPRLAAAKTADALKAVVEQLEADITAV